MANHRNATYPLIKALILEDSLLDIELMTSYLTGAGFQLEITHAKDEASFREALHHSKHDIILSDLNLPGFDAFCALKTAQEICPELPLICVSGCFGDETAIELLNNGAVDYVHKDHLNRLPIAVKRALDDAKAKQTCQQKSEDLALLLKASEILNESINKTTVLQKIVDTAVELTRMESSAIYMIKNDKLHLAATYPVLPDNYPDEFRTANLKDHWQINKTAQAKAMVVLLDTHTEKLSEQEQIVVNASGFKTLIYLPLIHENAVLGVLILGTITHTHHFCDEELNFFKTYANLSSAALQNAMLFEANKQHADKLKLLNRAVESSSVSVVITDAKGNIVYTNPWFTHVTGYSAEEVAGRKLRILNQDKLSDSDSKTLWRAILSGNDWSGEYQNRKKNGEHFWEKLVISPILNRNGELTNIISINEDITAQKKMMEELVAAKDNAEESDKLKSAFINNISHEIRTPLNGILGFAQIMTETELSKEERKEFLFLLEKSSDRLMNTVSDYMDMAMLVSNTLKVNKRDVELDSVFDIITTKTTKLCAEKQLTFTLEIPEDIATLTVYTDPEFLQKILEKLLDNAIKYTSWGNITCGCKLTGEHFAVFVKDTGMGIDEDKLELIFDAFRQADLAISRNYEGSGLGLTIAKTMVNLLGGEITVTSVKGQGSEFTFTLPLKKQVAITPHADFNTLQKRSIKNTLVLIAEDDEANYEFLAIVINSLGLNYIHAANGLEAVDFCKQNPEISLVLMDIKMPVMNGEEATRQIRTFRPDLPIIAITAHAMTGDETRILEAGCNEYLSKPVLKKDLLAVMNKYIV